jgi:hypothetical protein
MKKLLPVIALMLLYSCNSKKSVSKTNYDSAMLQHYLKFKDSPSMTFIGGNAVTIKQDTVIKQDVTYENGRYYLQTYIVTEKDQIHPMSNENYGIGIYTKFCPYYTDIFGTFEYIKANKKNEYMKAKDYFYKKTKADKLIKDNLDYLNSYKVGDWMPLPTSPIK